MAGKWDFREDKEIEAADSYINKGYLLSKIDKEVYGALKDLVNNSVSSYANINSGVRIDEIHKLVAKEESNRLRVHVLKELWSSDEINRLYYKASKEMVELLCSNEVAMQKKIGLSMQLPGNKADALPIHSDVWNGVSAYDLNILIPLVSCKRTMSLYILDRDSYRAALEEMPGLLKETSEKIYERLKPRLSWIEMEEGSLLAFDQTLPHGFCTNEEELTHWSLNCRFKTLFSPYADKLLGEYFMPVTTKACTLAGLHYSEPKNWLSEY